MIKVIVSQESCSTFVCRILLSVYHFDVISWEICIPRSDLYHRRRWATRAWPFGGGENLHFQTATAESGGLKNEPPRKVHGEVLPKESQRKHIERCSAVTICSRCYVFELLLERPTILKIAKVFFCQWPCFAAVQHTVAYSQYVRCQDVPFTLPFRAAFLGK